MPLVSVVQTVINAVAAPPIFLPITQMRGSSRNLLSIVEDPCYRISSAFRRARHPSIKRADYCELHQRGVVREAGISRGKLPQETDRQFLLGVFNNWSARRGR